MWLIGIGAGLAVTYFVVALLRLRAKQHTSLIASILALGSGVFILLGYTLSLQMTQPITQSTRYAIGSGFLLVTLATLILVMSLQANAKNSDGKTSMPRITDYGIHGIGIGLVAGLGVMALPMIYAAVLTMNVNTSTDALLKEVEAAQTVSAARNRGIQLQTMVNNVPDVPVVNSINTKSTGDRPTLAPTITPTPFTYTLPTPVPPICNGLVTANVNFREDPSLDSDIITVIPEGAVINIFEENGEWLRTTYDNRRGWVSATVVSLLCD